MEDRIRKRRNNINYYNGKVDELFVNGIYDDGNYNKENYGLGKKRYWNKVSGKWVESKFKVFKSDIIYWYVFENLNEKIIVDWFSDKDNELCGFQYIDSVGYFISLILKKSLLSKENKEDEEFLSFNKGVYLDDKTLIGLLGSGFKKVLRRLEVLKIIKVKEFGRSKYNFHKILRCYFLNYEILGELIEVKYNENKRVERNILKFENKEDLNRIELENIKKIKFEISEDKLNEICDLKFQNKVDRYKKELEWGNIFNSKIDKLNKNKFINSDGLYYKKVIKRRYRIYRDIIKDVNNNNIDYSLFFRDEFSGRYYNIINCMDKEFRNEIQIDGEGVVELDLRSCYVSCLFYFIERLKLIQYKGLKEIQEDYKWFDWKKDGKEIFKGYKDNFLEYELMWENRKKKYCEIYGVDEKYYGLGDCKDFELKDINNHIKNNEEYQIFFSEFYNVIRMYDYKNEVNEKFNINKNRLNINENWWGFEKSDKFIFECYKILDRRWLRGEFYKKLYSEIQWEFINKKIDVYEDGEIIGYNSIRGKYEKLVKGKDWVEDFKNYREYFESGNVIKIKQWDGVLEELEIDYFEKKIEKGKYKIKLNQISKKDSIKWMESESIRKKFNEDYSLYVNKKGIDIEIDLKEDLILDKSRNIIIDGFDFINKYKDICFNNIGKNFDFYDYTKLEFSNKYHKGNLKGLKKIGSKSFDSQGWLDKKIYDRNFYKGLLMRLMFSKLYLSDSINDWRLGDVSNRIFGENLNEVFYWLKSENLEVKYDKLNNNNYSENFKKIVDRSKIDDRHKNISKVLGLIEVDVVEYLEERYLKDKFYIKIFDGFMIKESDYLKYKIDLNMILKNEVGYMFNLR